jgi:hypothetical protein
MGDEHNLCIDRRSLLKSAAGFGYLLAMPLARGGVAEPGAVPVGKAVAVVDTRFDDAPRAASWLHADTQIALGAWPDAYRTWREYLRGCQTDEVHGLTTWSDDAVLRSCLERAGYRVAHERIVRGRVTLVNWSLYRRALS